MTTPEQYWIDRGKDLIGLDVLEQKDKARQASTYTAIAVEIVERETHNVLDVGCNLAALEMFIREQEGRSIRKHLVSYAGIDSNPEAVNYCRDKGLEVTCGSPQHIHFKAFECVVIKDVLEHLESLDFARGAFKLSEKSVILSFFIPPMQGPSIIRRMPAGYYHNQYSEKEVIDLADHCGFKLEKRIDTWETDGNMNRTYVFLRRAVNV